jgi:hypothetical protein
MGAVRFDIHDILSLSDLNTSDREYFEDTRSRRRSVRPGPAAIIHLAERGHWIKIPKQDIDDKSKADTVQKNTCSGTSSLDGHTMCSKTYIRPSIVSSRDPYNCPCRLRSFPLCLLVQSMS